MTEPRIKVGLVGCGQIADAHLQQIRRLPWAEPVAVCDLEPLLARQAAERFEVPAQFTDVERMLDQAKPDVVHVTTPVASHGPLARQLLRAGVHVYVEKPFAIDVSEARRIVAVAEECHRLVCVGHDQLFDPAWVECCRRVDSGEIGEVRHVDSSLGYPLRGAFGSQVIENPDHWVRRLPGGLFQNTISHPLYRITEFLKDPRPEVCATWFSQVPDVDFPTELHAHFRGVEVTGCLSFRSTTNPCERVTRIYGTQGGLEVDLDTQVIRTFREDSLPGSLGRLEAPFRQWGESTRNLLHSLGRFRRGEFHYFDGMKEIFRRFYLAILEDTEMPVSTAEMLRVTSLMDVIFAECREDERRRAQKRSLTDGAEKHSLTAAGTGSRELCGAGSERPRSEVSH